MYSAEHIAQAFLQQADQQGCSISPMKLQKLVYYAHGWYLGITGEPLLNEAVEAWKYGPVIPSLYHAYKQFAGNPIVLPATVLQMPLTFTEDVRALIDKIWQEYGHIDARKLSDMTHIPRGPWAMTIQQQAKSVSDGLPVQIANTTIAGYFARQCRADSDFCELNDVHSQGEVNG